MNNKYENIYKIPIYKIDLFLFCKGIHHSYVSFSYKVPSAGSSEFVARGKNKLSPPF